MPHLYRSHLTPFIYALLIIAYSLPRSIRKEIELNTEKSFRNLIKSTRIQIVFTIFLLIWNTNGRVRLVPNQTENGKYNLNSG